MRQINHIIIHHAAVSQPSANLLLKSCNVSHKERLHPNPNGFGYHCAYHYIIGADGKTLETRPLDEIGYHASNRIINTQSIGICLCGNLDVDKPTSEQLYSLKDLCNALIDGFGELKVSPHNKFAPYKTCPGKNFDMDKFKLYLKENTMGKPGSDGISHELGLRNGERGGDTITRREVAIMLGRLIKKLREKNIDI